MNSAIKTVLITGATSGIGRAAALLFAKNNYFVIVNGRNERRGNEVAQEVKGKFIQADVSSFQEVEKLFSELKSLDVLVNCAGGSQGTDDFYKSSTEDLEANFRSNFFSVFYCSQKAAKLIKEGVIVNVGSVCGLGATPVGEGETVPIYSAAKAALHNLSQNLAKLLAPKIRVNTVVPGYTKTPAWGEEFSHEEEDRLAQQSWIKRFVTAEEVADVIYHLATNKALTGAQIIIDGGMVLK